MPPKGSGKQRLGEDDLQWEWKKIGVDIAPEALVGEKVKVWWDGSKAAFEGTAHSFDDSSWKHKVRYDDGEQHKELLVMERVMVRRKAWPAPTTSQLVSLGAFLTQMAEAAEKEQPGRTARGRNVEGVNKAKKLLQCAQLVLERADLREEDERQQGQQQAQEGGQEQPGHERKQKQKPVLKQQSSEVPDGEGPSGHAESEGADDGGPKKKRKVGLEGKSKQLPAAAGRMKKFKKQQQQLQDEDEPGEGGELAPVEAATGRMKKFKKQKKKQDEDEAREGEERAPEEQGVSGGGAAAGGEEQQQQPVEPAAAADVEPGAAGSSDGAAAAGVGGAAQHSATDDAGAGGSAGLASDDAARAAAAAGSSGPGAAAGDVPAPVEAKPTPKKRGRPKKIRPPEPEAGAEQAVQQPSSPGASPGPGSAAGGARPVRAKRQTKEKAEAEPPRVKRAYRRKVVVAQAQQGPEGGQGGPPNAEGGLLGGADVAAVGERLQAQLPDSLEGLFGRAQAGTAGPEEGAAAAGLASPGLPLLPSTGPASAASPPMVLSSSRLMEILMKCKEMPQQAAGQATDPAPSMPGPGVTPGAAAQPAASLGPKQQQQQQQQQQVLELFQDIPGLYDWVTSVPDSAALARFSSWAERLSCVVSDVPLPNMPPGSKVLPMQEALDIIKALEEHPVNLGLLQGTQICKAVAMLRSHRNLNVAQPANHLCSAWRTTTMAVLQRATAAVAPGPKRGPKRTPKDSS